MTDFVKVAKTNELEPGQARLIDVKGKRIALFNKERAAGSPLVERLFALAGIAHVLVTENLVTVGKEPSASWSALKPVIGTAIRAQLLTGIPAILESLGNASAWGRTDAGFARLFKNCWTGKSTVLSQAMVDRFRSSTSAIERPTSP